ncbi:MAG: hypothetical protein WBP56_26270 [Polyangia bacterium]
MRRVPTFLMLLTIASVLTPALALAQQGTGNEQISRATVTGATSGNGRGFGLGAVQLLVPGNAPGPNILATWGDWGGRFHIDGMFGLASAGSTAFDLGARGWYHVHAASAADFSLGAGFAFISWHGAAPLGRQYDFELELGAQMRVFVVSNVALLASVGIGIYLPDSGSSGVQFTGNIMNTVGIAYYFQ